MAQSHVNDLGSEKLSTLLVRLAVPAITAQLINALYNIVDRMYIGRMEGVGALALTGVGLCFPILILISAFSSLVGMGGAPRASIKMGEGDLSGAERILGNCFTTLLVISALLTVVFHLFMEPMLYAFGASENTIPFAISYLRIYVTGTVFVQIAVGMNAFVTAQGFSKVSMYTVLIGAVLNIILDPIFIFGLGMGVRGAALASVISQGVSALWVLKFLFGKQTLLRIRRENFGFTPSVMLPVLALGLSPFVMQSTESLVNIVLNSSLQRYGGDLAVGAMTIIGSVSQLFMMPMSGLTQGGQPIMSFNYGARKNDRVRGTFRLVITCTLAFSISLWLLVQLFPGVFIGLFTSDAELMEFASWAIRIHMAGIFAMGAQIACQQALMAVGQAKISLLLALLRKIILLIPLAYLLPNLFGLGLTGVFLATPIADVLASTGTVTTFLLKFNKVLDRGPEPTT